MFKNFAWILALFFWPIQAFSQQTDKISLESGFTINQYFPKEKLHIQNGHPLNYFLKAEYSGKTFSNGRFSLFIPFGISYGYYTVDYISSKNLVNSGFKTGNTYHDLSIFAGPQLQYQLNRQRYCAALLLNNRYISTRIFGLYHTGKRFWIGPSLEMFFYDILYSLDERRKSKNIPNYERGNIFGLNGCAIRLNPGIKIQMDLKN